MIRFCAQLLALLMLFLATQRGIAQQVDFTKDVWPILQSRCVSCHGPDAQEGQLRLDAKVIAFQGGLTGIGIVPEKPNASTLYRRLISQEEGERMPAEAEALPAGQIALIRRWIEQGADWPDGLGSDVQEVRRHWAYVAPVRPDLPDVRQQEWPCLLYTSPSPRDGLLSRMPSSA